MKITNVKAMWLRVPIPEAKQSVSDFGRNDSFNTTLVRVETDVGLVGYGEAKATVGSIGAQRALTAVIEEELGPLLVGEDPRDIARLWEVMYNGSRAGHALSRGHVFPVLGRRGLTVCGVSGIDMALWDILGRSYSRNWTWIRSPRPKAKSPSRTVPGWV